MSQNLKRPNWLKKHISKTGCDERDEYHSLIATWILRMLLNNGSAFRGFFTIKGGFSDSDLAEFLLLQDVDEDEIKIRGCPR